MAMLPIDPNEYSDPIVTELQLLRKEIAELRQDLHKPTTFKISNQVSQGITNVMVGWLFILFICMVIWGQ